MRSIITVLALCVALGSTAAPTQDTQTQRRTLAGQAGAGTEKAEGLFFSQGSEWKYYDGELAPVKEWTLAAFDDASWASGSGKMGFGQKDEATVLAKGQAAYYFRKKVHVEAVEALDKVFIHLKHDDAAVLYINGKEVLRTELMPFGEITHASTAYQKINDRLQNQFITYTLDKSYFVDGENQLAVSVHNTTPKDSDLAFDCFFTPTYQYSQDGPYIFYENGKVVMKEVTPEGLVTRTYDSAEGVAFTCRMPDWGGKSFTFSLKPDLQVEPSVFSETPSKFLVISDFDNHIESLSMVLLGEGIMDENFNWIYGNGHLVISGDLFDRGVNVTESLWLLYKLESEAAAQGGKVHLIIGNHEMMNMVDDWRYIEGKYFTNAQLMGHRMLDLYGPDSEIGRWLRTKNIIIKLGDYAVMHAGISPQVAEVFTSYEQLNDMGRTRMNWQECRGDCATVNGSNGIYWYRGMARNALTQEQVDGILQKFGVRRVIIGHTKGSTIRSFYGGKVLAIDMDHAANFANGFMRALKFEMGCFYLFHTAGASAEYTQIGSCDVSLGTGEVEKIDLRIYPNPTSEVLNIDLPEVMKGENTFQIIGMSGQQVLSGSLSHTQKQIAVSSLTPGAYFLVIQGAQHSIKGKFIVK